MAQKIFTDESLQTLVNEIKTYTDNAVSDHSHDDRYCTESEVDKKLEDGLADVNESIAKLDPFIGTTTDVTPAQVAEAIISGKSVVVGHIDETFGILAANNFVISYSTNTVMASAIVNYDGSYIAYELYGDINSGIWGSTHTAIADQVSVQNAYALAESKADSLSDLGVNATAEELNYVDGVTSAIQTQLDGKAASTHNHKASEITSGTLDSARLPAATASAIGGVKIGSNISVSNGTISVPAANGTTAGVTIVYPAASCTTFSSDSGTVTPLAVQKGAKQFAITRPTTATANAIARFSNATATGDIKNSKIIIEDVTNTKNKNTANVLAIPAEDGKKMVYGYCTDQDDGTSFIGGVFDAGATEYPYSAGLAIGGTSGNLLWKGKKIATEEEIDSKLAGKSNTNHTHSELQSKINALTEQIEKLTARIALLESWHAMSGIGDVNGDGHITELDAKLIDAYCAGDLELTAEEMVRADVNGDMTIDGTDAMLIRKYLNGLNTGNPMDEFEQKWAYAGESRYGDINDDGYISSVDAMMVAKVVIGDKTLTAEQQRRADVNGDGVINVLDAMAIGQRLCGDIDKFPVEE